MQEASQYKCVACEIRDDAAALYLYCLKHFICVIILLIAARCTVEQSVDDVSDAVSSASQC